MTDMTDYRYGQSEDTTGCPEVDIRDQIVLYRQQFNRRSCESMADTLREMADWLEKEKEGKQEG